MYAKLRLLQHSLVRGGKIGKVGGVFAQIAPPLKAWTDARDLWPIEEKTFRERWRAELRK